MNCTLWKDQLDAYLDGELPDRDSAAMDEHLRSCSDCASEAFRRMQMKRATRAAALRFTPPAGLREKIERSVAPKRRRLGFLKSPALAFAVALVLLAAVSAFVMVQRSEREHVLAEFVDLHVSALASANPVDVVSTDRHTVKPWFQGKLPFTFNLPELEGTQYKLVGGKLVFSGHHPGAQLLFELHKHELSVFILQNGERVPAAPSSQTEDGFSVESWSENGLSCTVVSDAGAGDVHALGELIRTANRR
ncbi:MAG TPA: zf-HC2 domain-containing protein [Terracidiphilus sp.]|nr:zf-HC2 domain-containing protein [Terracidiphilus sp.]